ncbi:MAG: DMT family transporter [Tepidimonas sp.]|uniref:DMT family transporter n=1 Tax=Tepidimonas sp. TaxID=2002775 RepID=UPI00298F1091|nr:DMT family transporter [Tepidimonas sp.]MDW8335531.1 DMT family transporter [Tepidimonas sp.]
MGTGVLWALAAGLLWGLVFVTPLMLPHYPAALLSVGRYLAFGLLCLPLAWLDRHELRRLRGSDWRHALELALVGNLLYYLLLASSIQRTGGPLSTVIIGTLPVVIALVANRRDAARDGRLPWRRLSPALALILAGIALVNQAELQAVLGDPQRRVSEYALGALLAVGAVACWTWYPLRNADWLRAHPERSPRAWSTAQGLATLPLALLGYALLWGIGVARDDPFPLPLGPQPQRYVVLMVSVGLLASWLGTLCWNAASQRLPTALAGQLIVFETLAALLYAYLWRGQGPEPAALAGIVLLVAGVLWGVRVRPQPVVAQAHPD